MTHPHFVPPSSAPEPTTPPHPAGPAGPPTFLNPSAFQAPADSALRNALTETTSEIPLVIPSSTSEHRSAAEEPTTASDPDATTTDSAATVTNDTVAPAPAPAPADAGTAIVEAGAGNDPATADASAADSGPVAEADAGNDSAFAGGLNNSWHATAAASDPEATAFDAGGATEATDGEVMAQDDEAGAGDVVVVIDVPADDVPADDARAAAADQPAADAAGTDDETESTLDAQVTAAVQEAQTAIEEATAELEAAQADLHRADAELTDAQQEFDEAEEVTAAAVEEDLYEDDEEDFAEQLRPGDLDEAAIAIWDPEVADRYRDALRDIQAHFVDDPEAALGEAQDLIAEAVQALADALLAEQVSLDPHEADANPDTESMRIAMRGYRDFLERVLAL